MILNWPHITGNRKNSQLEAKVQCLIPNIYLSVSSSYQLPPWYEFLKTLSLSGLTLRGGLLKAWFALTIGYEVSKPTRFYGS